MDELPAGLQDLRALRHSDRGTTSLVGGLPAGGLLQCGDGPTGGCLESSEAALGLAWTPLGSAVSLFAAVLGQAINKQSRMNLGVAFVGGLRFTPAALLRR